MGAGSPGRWVVLLAAIGLIAVVALTSRSGLVVPVLGVPDTSAFFTLAEAIGYVAIGLGVIAVPLSIALYRRRWRAARAEVREQAEGPMPWWLRLLGLAVVLAFVGGQAIVAGTFLDELRKGRGEPGATLAPSEVLDPGTLGDGSRDPTALIIATVLLVAIALLAVAVAVRWRTLDRATGLADVERRQATQEALEISLDALRSEPDPRRAVIAAYAGMERSLAKAGFGRVHSEAPLEYLRRVLDVSGLADDHLRTITLLFQHARFSEHPVQESMRARAIDALGSLRATIGERA